MSVGIALQELLAWNQESSRFWKSFFDANPQVLALPCDIGGCTAVQEFVCHIWGVELRWGQRLAGLPVTPKENFPKGPLDALFDLHVQADAILAGLLAGPEDIWKRTLVLDLSWLPPEERSMSRRKVALHALFHSQRHWAQLATLARAAGYPTGFRGDLIFSPVLR
jgi:uncharacterized damage-inducible protein DinB